MGGVGGRGDIKYFKGFGYWGREEKRIKKMKIF